MLLIFKDKYFECNGGYSINEKILPIGGYELAFLADLDASYLFEVIRNKFYFYKYYIIYKDDRLVVFQGIWTTCQIKKWLLDLQSHINTFVGNAHLVFTAAIWTNNPYDQNIGNINVIRGNSFPYLDMEFYCDIYDRLNT